MDTVKPIDVIEKHGLNVRSYSGAVQGVMAMNNMAARRLLLDLVDFPVNIPGTMALTQLVVASLVQTEIRFRLQNGGQSVIPFNEADFSDALSYAKHHQIEHASVYPSDDIQETPVIVNGEAPTVPVEGRKRGRKAKTFPIIMAFYKDNAGLSPNDAAKILSEEHGLNENTARVYWYKCIKMAKAGTL